MTVQNRSLGTARLNRRHFLALASGATVSAILAACGGSSSPTATTVAPTKAATAAAQPRRLLRRRLQPRHPQQRHRR